MSITLHLEPKRDPMSWKTFCRIRQKFSIAIDGYVKDGPKFDPHGPRRNLNHHEGVDRLSTRATCEQARLRVRMGLYDRFRDADGPCAHVYANDCDEDVCMTWYILSHPEVAQQTYGPIFNRLVGMVDALDSTAGAYPMHPDAPILQELDWIFQPYRQFRASGRIDRRDADEFRAVVDAVSSRIGDYLAGRGEKVTVKHEYVTIGGGAGWSMFQERTPGGRVAAFRNGVKAYVIVRERADGATAFTIGRVSDDIPFPVTELLAALNRAEKDASRKHGGGPDIGGSNRARGSRFTPAQIEKIVNDFLASCSP